VRRLSLVLDSAKDVACFIKDANGDIFHTYSSFGRGGEDLHAAYRYLDITPKGRDETGPHLRCHDRYDDAIPDRTGVAASRRPVGENAA
jgi:predicted dithiol-disulfide oxidoreductase (DUF899 family)